MTDVFLRERKGRFGYRGTEETQGRGPCEDGGRDYRVMHPQAKEGQGVQATPRSWEMKLILP